MCDFTATCQGVTLPEECQLYQRSVWVFVFETHLPQGWFVAALQCWVRICQMLESGSVDLSAKCLCRLRLHCCVLRWAARSSSAQVLCVGMVADLAEWETSLLCYLQPVRCWRWWHIGSVRFVLIAECKSASSVPCGDVRGLPPLSRYPWPGPHIAEPSHDSGKRCIAVWQCFLIYI